MHVPLSCLSDDLLGFLSVFFSKAFDLDMCPLPFMLDKIYHFVEVRFGDASAYVQEQALQWLQVRGFNGNMYHRYPAFRPAGYTS